MLGWRSSEMVRSLTNAQPSMQCLLPGWRNQYGGNGGRIRTKIFDDQVETCLYSYTFAGEESLFRTPR